METITQTMTEVTFTSLPSDAVKCSAEFTRSK